MFSEVILKTAIALLSAISGSGLTLLIKLDHKKLCVLISLSAGALLGAAAFTLIPESSINLSLIEVLLSGLSGFFLFWVISKYYAHICPACSASHFDEQTTKKFSEIILTLFTALSFHSLLDGIAISTGSMHGYEENNSIFLAITTHKFPEGLALASLMFGANYSKVKIISYVVLIELTTVVGGVIGYFLIKDGFPHYWMGILMAHIAGGFVFLAMHAILGEMLKNHKALVTISFISGLVLIFLTRLLVH
jgi:zinc transporter ZupT